MKKKCALVECGITIPKSRHGNATTCCKSHAKLMKVKREKSNYQKMRQYIPNTINNDNTGNKLVEQNSIFNGTLYQDQFPFRDVTYNKPELKLAGTKTTIKSVIKKEATTIKHKAGRPRKYSTPELIKSIITDKTIELVYKRQHLANNNENPNPEVYKDIYNRFNGSVRRVIGTYIPVKAESFEFYEF
jgi:hypothetical protein